MSLVFKPFLKDTYIVSLLCVVLFLFVLEKKIPLRKSRRAILPRLNTNIILSILTFLMSVTIVRPTALLGASWSYQYSIGILNWLDLNGGIKTVLGILLLDLSFYYWHRLTHFSPLVWRFHNVHHFDPDLDLSTGFRFHFGEVLISVVFRFLQIVIIGPDLKTFLIFEFVFQIGTFFHHSNLRLPMRLEKFLNLIFVTPRMHGIHHSQLQQETDSNYGVIFSVWDRLHGTYLWNSRGEFKDELGESLVIGVPGYDKEADNSVWSALLSPFRKQRLYWAS